jgi:hypothetical protein
VEQVRTSLYRSAPMEGRELFYRNHKPVAVAAMSPGPLR